MFDSNYITAFTEGLKNVFGSRLCYVGLQGSYMRGEANEDSDIDFCVIIDKLTINDMASYRRLTEEMGNSEKTCGFICGKDEMANWNTIEICQLFNTTEDIYGNLLDYVPLHLPKDEINYIKLSLDNLYHELCHRFIHGKKENTEKAMPAMYKSAYFILQNVYYAEHFAAASMETHRFVKTKKELLSRLDGTDKKVMEIHMGLKQFSFEEEFEILFSWCQNRMITLKSKY